MGTVPFRAAYQTQPSALKMKFLIVACLILSAVAKPKPQHETVGFTKYLNGAVVPVDTTSVLQQKALHGAAHATAAVNGFKSLFYVRPAVAPVVELTKLVVPYYTGYPYTTYPYGGYYGLYSGKKKMRQTERSRLALLPIAPEMYGFVINGKLIFLQNK